MKYYKDLLTIGIPAYNEEKYIRQTIESCINQAGCVIVSDNASTDNTQKICEELAQKYPNLKYIRQEENFGSAQNFNFVLKEAKTKYFMWHGGHDYIDSEYTAHMLHMLENSDAVGCYPASRQVDNDNIQIGIYDFWYANKLVSDCPSERVYTLIAHLHEVSALFGIYRTEIAQAFPLKPIIGNDHVFVCNMALNGRLFYSPRSVYNWRQTKINLSHQENLMVWENTLGNAQNKVLISSKEMQEDQIAILKKAGFRGINPIAKIRLLNKANKKLRKRFGD